jgi:hypothetical protein
MKVRNPTELPRAAKKEAAALLRLPLLPIHSYYFTKGNSSF